MSRPVRLFCELLEDRLVPSSSPLMLTAIPAAGYAADGSGNNLAHPSWGSAGSDLLRLAPAAYGDGVASPAGADRPAPRTISNALADQAGQDLLNREALSAMAYAWGQFLDHDIGLTPTGATEPLASPVPTGDPSFDPAGTGAQTIATTRSAFDPATGAGAGNPRQQVNTVTAFIDGSMIYGSDAATQAALRTFQGGRLKTGAGNLLPDNTGLGVPGGSLPMANDAHRVTAGRLFAAGDVRANENIELTALQTLFVREHNAWAGRIAAANPGLGDEAVFQRARAVVIGEIQAITYNEWLPALLGRGALRPYAGYNPSVHPGLSNEFSTAAFRFGHSLLGDDIEFLDDRGLPVRDGVSLAEAFFNPDLLRQSGIDPLLKYLASDPAQALDTKVVDSVRNFLFGPPGSGGLDLATLNILRGRDHGLADYNTVRAAYGLPRVTSFAQVTSDRALQTKLRDLYGSVDRIDLWVGALAEDHGTGAAVGPTVRTIVADQFRRLRDGDRFWYQNVFSGSLLKTIDGTRLADVIARNTGLTSVQDDVFHFRASVSGVVFADNNRDGRQQPGEPGLAGRVVQLVEAATGAEVATTTTDRAGRYQFGVSDGLRTGVYLVRLLDAQGGVTGVQGRTATITAGGQFLRNVNLAVPSSPGPGPSRGNTGGVKSTPLASAAAPSCGTVSPAAVDTLMAALAAADPSTPRNLR